MDNSSSTGIVVPKIRACKPNSSCNSDYQNSNVHQHEGDTTIVGTCAFMCPEAERVRRERLRDLSVFERLNGNPAKTGAHLAVKKFCRTLSIKDLHMSDLRPLPVLEETLNYLLKLPHSKQHQFEVVHDFIFDRTRSIRQDLSMQNIVSDRAISMYEDMVKFHVISHHKLKSCGGSSISSAHHLNLEQLTKALTTLYNLYDANRSPSHAFNNESEFRSYYVLLHLDSGNRPMGESLSLWFRCLPSPVLKSKEMSFARTILRLYRMGNYKQFLFTTSSQASYLQYCIVESYISEVRILGLSCINNTGYKLHPYPLENLSKLLMMEESEVESLCNVCGLETCTDNAGNKSVATKQITFCSSKGRPLKTYTLIGFKRGITDLD